MKTWVKERCNLAKPFCEKPCKRKLYKTIDAEPSPSSCPFNHKKKKSSIRRICPRIMQDTKKTMRKCTIDFKPGVYTDNKFFVKRIWQKNKKIYFEFRFRVGDGLINIFLQQDLIISLILYFLLFYNVGVPEGWVWNYLIIEDINIYLREWL